MGQATDDCDPCDSAEGDGEFVFNLFSDVAPILPLFGEQFARQFMSESLIWMDHIIFAMVPLGIVAAITGAIRVQGPRFAKALIGHVRENRAQAEFELLSSTSHEVGEAFNGKGIVRVLGRPHIAEFLIFPSKYNEIEKYYKGEQTSQGQSLTEEDRQTCGIHSLESVVELPHNLMHCDKYRGFAFNLKLSIAKGVYGYFRSRKTAETDAERADPQSTEARSKGLTRPDKRNLGPPNLQLNLASDRIDDGGKKRKIEMVIATVVSLVVQIGLLVLAVVTTQYAPVRQSIAFGDPKAYGFPCYVAGSVLLSLGVAFCSYVVEKNTKELAWTVPGGDNPSVHHSNPHLIYLQRGQTVNDQAFDPYIIFGGQKFEIVASARADSISERPTPEDILERSPDGAQVFWEYATAVAGAVTRQNYAMLHVLLRPPKSREEVLYAVKGRALDGMTLLHLAAQSDDPSCLHRLVKAGAEMNGRDIWGREPVHIAARWAQEEALALILKTKRWSLASDSLGHTPIDYLLATDDSNPRITDQARLDIFVKFYFNNPGWLDQRGKTFLHHAIQKTDTKTVKTLVKDNTGIAVADSEGVTPLMLAVENNMQQVVDDLLQSNGAVMVDHKQYQDNDGNSAAHHVLAEKNHSYANDDEHVQILQALHRAGCNLALENAKGDTVLSEALLRHHRPVAECLLEPTEVGIPKAIGRVKSTLLYEACLAGSADAVSTILQFCDRSVNAALSAADLINTIGDTYSRDTPIIISCAEGHTDIIKMLVADERTDLNWAATGWFRGTPLHIVAYRGNLGALSVLLEHWPARINTDVFDRECMTPLDRAIQGEEMGCAEKLLKPLLMSKPYQKNHVEILPGRRGVPSPFWTKEFSGRLSDLISRVLGPITAQDVLPDECLAWLVRVTRGFECWSLCDQFIQKALTTSAWKLIPDLYQIALGNGEH